MTSPSGQTLAEYFLSKVENILDADGRFECAATIDGEHCDNDEPGNYRFLGALTFCMTHQEQFEDLVTSGVLEEQVREARWPRSQLFKVFTEKRDPVPAAPTFTPDRKDMRAEATVYFMRCGEFVKIGYSVAPHLRLRQIQSGTGTKFPEGIPVHRTAIIATEDGGYNREQALHKQFAHLRHTGEWFTEAPELTEYIETLEGSAA